MDRSTKQLLDKAGELRRSLGSLRDDIDDMFDCLNGHPTSKQEKNDAPEHVLANYTLAMEDNFEGPALDPNKWSTRLIWGPDVTINREEQYYVDVLGGDGVQPAVNPFVFNAAGNLEIQVIPIPEGQRPVTTNGVDGGQRYWSGMLTTRDTHCFTYGYAEVCMKLPCTSGSWPAAWLLNCNYYNTAFGKNQAERNGQGNDKFNPEIDFMESVEGNGNNPNCIKNAYHYFTGDRTAPTHTQWQLDGSNFTARDANTGQQFSAFNQFVTCDGSNDFRIPETCDQDFCDNFHTVAVDWQPGYIHYYIDGQLVNCINGPADIISDQAMYLLINFAVGGSFPYGFPPSQFADVNDYPAAFEIEYARLYTL